MEKRNAPILPSDIVIRMKSSGSATGNPRNKTALAPGHSVMDWIRLGNSGVDLTGVGGIPRTVTLSELANHNKQNDAWIAIRGIVYNVTRYMDFHPGGIEELMKGVGKDATKLFDNVHAWVNYQGLLQKCVVGRLCSSLSTTSETTVNDISENKPTQSKNDDNIDFCYSTIKLDWKQTADRITFFYPAITNYQGVYYRISKKSCSRLVFDIILEKIIVTHELQLIHQIRWPPEFIRNPENMTVEFWFEKATEAVWTQYGSYTLSKQPVPKERLYKEYEVVSNVPLSKLVNMLILRAKNSLEVIPIGRHLEARMKIEDMEVSRYYTPVPVTIVPKDVPSDYTADCICLIIKRYPDGALSPSITSLQATEKLTLSNALGDFTIESFDRYSAIHMLAAGTGLTPMLGIFQRSLYRRTVKYINIVNFNKDEDNMFYMAQLERVCKGTKVNITHILSQPSDSWEGRRGTVSDELLKELVGDCSPEGCVFVCGPEGFMTSARKCLNNLNWKPQQMYEFDG